ncbi:hypothetical protein S1361_12630 [Streptomyces cyanogenus]|uniref:Uncharacterized protein n=1 Tax=Streptomyces cyanogenus TaxID=80860 RepID=A0ABX7TNA4_STRCY|nr:hypothetical protein S1361_12630 [Streptomyces cyanogenus]
MKGLVLRTTDRSHTEVQVDRRRVVAGQPLPPRSQRPRRRARTGSCLIREGQETESPQEVDTTVPGGGIAARAVSHRLSSARSACDTDCCREPIGRSATTKRAGDVRQIDVAPPSQVHARVHGTGVQQTPAASVNAFPDRSCIADTERLSVSSGHFPTTENDHVGTSPASALSASRGRFAQPIAPCPLLHTRGRPARRRRRARRRQVRCGPPSARYAAYVDPKVKAIWELHLNMELEHLHTACDLMRRG